MFKMRNKRFNILPVWRWTTPLIRLFEQDERDDVFSSKEQIQNNHYQ